MGESLGGLLRLLVGWLGLGPLGELEAPPPPLETPPPEVPPCATGVGAELGFFPELAGVAGVFPGEVED